MSWAVGTQDGRDVGYGVPAFCEQPTCDEVIDRGLAYVCGGMHGGGDIGCGRYFCGNHRYYVTKTVEGVDYFGELCMWCDSGEDPVPMKPDHPDWVAHKLTDESWGPWRAEHPEWVAQMSRAIP